MPEAGRSDRSDLSRRRWLGQALALGAWTAMGRTPTFGRSREGAEDVGDEPGGLFIETGLQNPAPLLGLFAVDPESSQWRRVLGEARFTARISPDRRSVAFQKYRRQDDPLPIWIADLRDGGEPRRLTDLRGRICWEPDGKALFVSGLAERDGDAFQTWRVPLDGSEKTRLPLPAEEQVLDISDDGRWLLTASVRGITEAGRRSRSYKVFIRRADGSDPQLLTEGTRYVTHRFAPDGRRVVFAKNEGEREVYSLHVIGRDGKDDRCLIKGDDEQSAFFACWSPDGKRLAVDLLDNEKDDKGKVNYVARHLEILELESGRRRDLKLPFAEAIPVDWR